MIGNQIAGFFSVGAPPIPPSNFESIQTVTVGSGGSSTITFSSIPSTYKHLQIRSLNLSGIASTDILMRFNSDTGSNYSFHYLYGTGATPGSQGSANQTYAISGFAGGSSSGGFVTDILDYTNTNKYKTSKTLSGYDQNGSGFVLLESSSWRNTNAITSITLTPFNTSFFQYSSFALYGIKGA